MLQAGSAEIRQTGTAPCDPYRIMIVDDSAVIRGFLARWLEAESDIKIVAVATNGVMALREFERFHPEVVILDIEMPEMDGLTALPKLIALDKDVQVIMASTLTRRNAAVSLEALSKGAADYIAKPESTRVAGEKEIFQRELTEKVRALGERRRSKSGSRQQKMQGQRRENVSRFAKPATSAAAALKPIALRAIELTHAPKILAIGASTGGPQALFKLFADLKGKVSLPILVTQHMPATFTTILAEHLSKFYDKPCTEAKDGEAVMGNHVYIAPGDWHMTVVKAGLDVRIKLTQDAPENYCRPSVDPMLRSLRNVYGDQVLTVILTGMGHDGLEGCRGLAAAGAPLIGQDEKTSVVWGMPGAVANAGLCNSVLPLQEIPMAIEKFISGRPS